MNYIQQIGIKNSLTRESISVRCQLCSGLMNNYIKTIGDVFIVRIAEDGYKNDFIFNEKKYYMKSAILRRNQNSTYYYAQGDRCDGNYYTFLTRETNNDDFVVLAIYEHDNESSPEYHKLLSKDNQTID